MRSTLWLVVAGLCWATLALADRDHAHHEHAAPHGGALVRLGDEFAHLEFVVDSETGQITAYVLDGEAERGVPVSQSSLGVEVRAAGREPFAVTLMPVENVLTGETRGRTSQFEGRSERLQGLPRFQGEVRRLGVRGRSFEHVPFRFPEGNEASEGHEGRDAHEDRS